MDKSFRYQYNLIDHLTDNAISRYRSRILSSRLFSGPPRLKLLHDKIIAVHYPKAGGSSLRQQFVTLLGSALCLNYHLTRQEQLGRSINFPKGKSMVFGHFRPDLYGDAEAFRMTFLRHPIDNAVSIYAFWKTQPPNKFDALHRKFLEERPSIWDFCQYPRIRNLMSEIYFGGYDMGRFDFIGFHEDRESDIPRLSPLIGADLSVGIRCNATIYNEQDETIRHSEIVKNKIATILKKDISFYEKTRSFVERRGDR